MLLFHYRLQKGLLKSEDKWLLNDTVKQTYGDSYNPLREMNFQVVRFNAASCITDVI